MTSNIKQIDPYVTVQLGFYNLRTAEWVAGLGYLKTGNPSIDRSWVWFEVVADNQEGALEEVTRYVKSAKAKFTGMHVVLKGGGIAVVGQDPVTIIEY